MTEEEWLTCNDPTPMLEYMRGRAVSRQWRQFACGCCRRVWPLLANADSRAAIEAAEGFADGRVTRQELSAAQSAAFRAVEQWLGRSAWRSTETEHARRMAAATAAHHAARPTERVRTIAEAAIRTAHYTWLAERGGLFYCRETGIFQCQTIRCILGNPFRPVSRGPWVTPAAVTVAQDIYDRRDFSALPLLADLLEEAGCPEQSVLDHCRQPGDHARGCWAVDLVLGKS
jgi:hypothetical protein